MNEDEKRDYELLNKILKLCEIGCNYPDNAIDYEKISEQCLEQIHNLKYEIGNRLVQEYLENKK